MVVSERPAGRRRVAKGAAPARGGPITNRVASRSRAVIVHPLCFAVHPALFLLGHNAGQLTFAAVVQPLLITAGAACAAWAVLAVLLRNAHKAGLIVSLSLVLFSSHRHAASLFGAGSGTGLLTATWIALFLVGAAALVRTARDVRPLSRILDVVGVALILMSAIQIARFQLTTGDAAPDVAAAAVPPGSPALDAAGEPPDIYFIVLDAYARADVLGELYDFDNSAFVRWLEEEGFYVAEESVANYCQTALAISSCFNLRYLDEWVRQVGEDSSDHRPLRQSIKNAYLLSFLRQRGYTIVAFSTGQPETELETADVYIPTGMDFEAFKKVMVNTTPVLNPHVIPGTKKPFDVYRDRIRYIFDHLGRLHTLDRSPMFVFAHIEIPHPPFVFGPAGEERYPTPTFHDRDGNWLIRPGGFTREQYVRAYRDQVVYSNRRIRQAIEEILRGAPRPPVIILLGDHGPRSQLVWESPERTNQWECLSILYAVHVPGGHGGDLYPQISPVNTFRILLNRLFGTGYERLDDRSYFSTAERLYEFHDVTERVRRGR